MYRRFRWTATALVVAVVMLAPTFAFAQQSTFNDLGSVPWAVQAIQAMARQGVMLGTGSGAFSPDSDLTRAQMATVLGRYEHWQPSAQGATHAFSDWASIPAWAMPYVATAAQMGILRGMPGGTFMPQGTLKWADLAIIVARAFNYPTVPQADIPGLLAQLVNGAQTPAYAQQAVAEDVQAGDFAGILAELYKPNKPVSRAELALFLDQAASGSSTAQTGIAKLAMSPTPIAAAGSLTAGKTVDVTVTADNASGAPVAGATLYLSFTPATGGGSASVNGTALTSTPAAFTTGSGGTVTVTYAAPATLPTSGTDTLTAASAASGPSVTATDSYSFGAATASVAKLALSPSPIAATGSLTAGKTVTVTAATYDASGNPVPGATVYLSFTPATGGGSASVNGTALTATPAAFTAGSSGTVTVTYTAPATLPTSGTDTLTAANAASGAAVTATDTYSFGTASTQVTGATVGALQITVTTAGGQTASYPLAPDVTVTLNGQPSTLAAITAGQIANLTLNSQGQVTAVDIVTTTSTGTSGMSSTSQSQS